MVEKSELRRKDEIRLTKGIVNMHEMRDINQLTFSPCSWKLCMYESSVKGERRTFFELLSSILYIYIYLYIYILDM